MTEVASRADFSSIRYAQCWEDADILLSALNIQPEHLSFIASAGDNSFGPFNRRSGKSNRRGSQCESAHCLELRMAAYRRLAYGELLLLMGSRRATAQERRRLYRICRQDLTEKARLFWDMNPEAIAKGIGSAGKFEHYFATFRRHILPLVHRRSTVERLLKKRNHNQRREFYDKVWDNIPWRTLFRLFFSRKVMGALGRDPAFFRYVEGSVSDRILRRSRHALRHLDPSQNPYLHWILCGTHGEALPLALREEHFQTIRDRLDRIEPRLATIETVLNEIHIDRANLSDIFEYMDEEPTQLLLRRLTEKLRAKVVWSIGIMLVPRQSGSQLGDHLNTLEDLGTDLLANDKAWFYSRLVIEERTKQP